MATRPWPHCIVLANIAFDFVVGQPPFFEGSGECGKSLCGVPLARRVH
jgi:hypothetical protein